MSVPAFRTFVPTKEDFDKQHKLHEEQEKKIQCKVECPLKSYWECQRCWHNKNRDFK